MKKHMLMFSHLYCVSKPKTSPLLGARDNRMLSSSLFVSSILFMCSSPGLFSSLLLSSSLFQFSIPGLFSSMMLFSPSFLFVYSSRGLLWSPGLSSSLYLSSLMHHVATNPGSGARACPSSPWLKSFPRVWGLLS